MKKAIPIILSIVAVLALAILAYTLRPQPEIAAQKGAEQLAPVVAPAAEATGMPTSAEDTLNAAAALTTANAAETKKSAAAQQPIIAPEGRFLGRADAPIQIIEFASLTCGHCAAFHNQILPAFRTKYVDTGLVRLEFQAFPLNKPALDATKILNCLPEDKFYPFMSMLFETQDHWAFTGDYLVPLRQNAKLAGMSDAAFDACLKDKAAQEKMAAEIQANVAKYKIESTPTFIVNDGAARITGAQPIAAFDELLKPFVPATPATTPTPSVP